MISNVAKVRKRTHLTQEQLANEIGISRRALSSIENGVSVPSVDVALQLARRLNTHVEKLFEIEALPAAPLKDEDDGQANFRLY